MGRSISLFSGYSQSENRTTNYCLLILRLLYEESPKLLAEVFNSLVGDDFGNNFGISFYQQKRKKGSVPDGLIIQKALNVYIETKNYDWFYSSQLGQHLENLNKETSGAKLLIALGKFESKERGAFDDIISLIKNRYKDDMYFIAISFEEFLQAIQQVTLPIELKDFVTDFENYLNEQNLLPQWKTRLDVVNCAKNPEENQKYKAYFCPAKGGSYSHKRCQYFGVYYEKSVKYVARIEAVVDVLDEEDAEIKWNNFSRKSSEVKDDAKNRLKKARPGAYPTRVFLLDELIPTNFVKETTGGMLSSKKYFDISELEVEDAHSLAKSLKGRSWSELY